MNSRDKHSVRPQCRNTPHASNESATDLACQRTRTRCMRPTQTSTYQTDEDRMCGGASAGRSCEFGAEKPAAGDVTYHRRVPMYVPYPELVERTHDFACGAVSQPVSGIHRIRRACVQVLPAFVAAGVRGHRVPSGADRVGVGLSAGQVVAAHWVRPLRVLLSSARLSASCH